MWQPGRRIALPGRPPRTRRPHAKRHPPGRPRPPVRDGRVRRRHPARGRRLAAPGPAAAADADAKAPLSAEGRYIVILKDGKSVDAATGRAGKRGIKADKTFRHAVRGYAARLAADQLATLRSDPDVQAVVPDEVISIAGQSIPTGVRRVGGQREPDRRHQRRWVPGGRRRRDRGHGDRRQGLAPHEDLNIAGGINCATQQSGRAGATPTATARTWPARWVPSTTASASSGWRRACGCGRSGSSTRRATA